ncbi:hypothetical protein OO013_15685 [Mangrovivirga sp. M17]|uniref:DNA mimic protein DMP19 C-terminal domain-containing protein n=1 Tax=Mangrovivirga halotolerans TaxID=2993936 RepID=A0ABT3RU65_9BACT|nr:hypothetical protein [Mangrovivirga halotolerans]MCX2745319.1 hypothetical protein [Mangrovivirga halotolerans]
MNDNKGLEEVFLLTDNSDFSIALQEILVKRYSENPSSLNEVQLNLFLTMHLEDAGQADSILSFLQEEFPGYKERVIESLNEIGAIQSSKIIKQAVSLLPKDGSWFYENSDEDAEKLMDQLDIEFSNYPDGSLKDLYRKYAEERRDQF